MAAVPHLSRSEVVPAKSNDAGDGANSADNVHANAQHAMLAEVQQVRYSAGAPQPSHADKAARLASGQLVDQSDDIFKVKSGPFKGMQVPDDLRCGIFASNIAVKAGIISPSEVTVRALEFAQTIKKHGYHEETFKPGKNYPDGSYIVGNGAHDGTNSRHVAMVVGGHLVHTNKGNIVEWPIEKKFFPGAYDSMKVYTPPKH
jgi:hypothetical protein